MTFKKRLLTATAFALILTLFVTTSAFAHYCTNANKKAGAGSIGTYYIATATLEPSGQPNGGFLTIVDGSHSYDVFIHQLLPEGALAAGPDGDNQCDGQGVDNFLVCIGYSFP